MQSMTVNDVDMNRDGIPDVSMDEDAPCTSRTVAGDDSSEESDRDSGRSIITDAFMPELLDNPKQEDRQVEEGSSARTSDPSASPWRQGNFARIWAEVARREVERERELLEELGVPGEKRPRRRGRRQGARDGWSWGQEGGLGPGAELFQRAVR